MPPPIPAVVHLLALNGLRLGDILTARVEHLGSQDGLTTLRLPRRKGGVLDVVSLPAETVATLDAAIAGRDRGILLRTTTGRALKAADIYRMLDTLSDAARLDRRVRPHMLRASFVTLALDAEIPARDIMASTGQATVEMVAYYDRAHASVRRNASHRLAASLKKERD